MKRYRFRLEQVLRVRRVEQDVATAALTRARLDHAVARDRESAAFDRYASATWPPAAVGIARFEAEREQLERRAQAANAAAQHTAEQLAVVAERRVTAVGARQRVNALENLDARRRDEHTFETLRSETLVADEQSALRWTRAQHGMRSPHPRRTA